MAGLQCGRLQNTLPGSRDYRYLDRCYLVFSLRQQSLRDGPVYTHSSRPRRSPAQTFIHALQCPPRGADASNIRARESDGRTSGTVNLDARPKRHPPRIVRSIFMRCEYVIGMRSTVYRVLVPPPNTPPSERYFFFFSLTGSNGLTPHISTTNLKPKAETYRLNPPRLFIYCRHVRSFLIFAPPSAFPSRCLPCFRARGSQLGGTRRRVKEGERGGYLGRSESSESHRCHRRRLWVLLLLVVVVPLLLRILLSIPWPAVRVSFRRTRP